MNKHLSKNHTKKASFAAIALAATLLSGCSSGDASSSVNIFVGSSSSGSSAAGASSSATSSNAASESSSSQETSSEAESKPDDTSSQPDDTSAPTSSAPETSKPETSSPETSKPESVPTDNPEIKPTDPKTDVTDDDIVYYKDGIVIVGNRSYMLFYGNPAAGVRYAQTLNKYKAALPDVNVYCMVIPTSCEFYSPPSIEAVRGSQLYNINTIAENLVGIKNVDAYTALATHAKEDIYLRTDHHWSALGGYYAAQELAKAAGVPFLDLSKYQKHVNHGYCGSMYNYAEKSPILKNNPEDFVYYTPTGVDYTTTYINYKLQNIWDIVGAYDPVQASFFLDYGDNGSENYCTFMAGDAKIVHVTTDTKNGRKLCIFKDSYGNAVPGFLFGSFEDIYVCDLRFFTHNAIDFMKEKGITDLVFINNTFIAETGSMIDRYENLLTQKDWGF